MEETAAAQRSDSEEMGELCRALDQKEQRLDALQAHVDRVENVYEDEMGALRAELADVQRHLAAELADAQRQLAETQRQLAETQRQLAISEQQVCGSNFAFHDMRWVDRVNFR
jgi:hypothetical protein